MLHGIAEKHLEEVIKRNGYVRSDIISGKW